MLSTGASLTLSPRHRGGAGSEQQPLPQQKMTYTSKGHRAIALQTQLELKPPCPLSRRGTPHLKPLPSCLRKLWKITVLAGALTPMAKVSVEKSTLTRPRQNSISTTSFMMGSRPAETTQRSVRPEVLHNEQGVWGLR